MPGVFQVTLDNLMGEIDELRECGVTSVLLFGIPDHKDAVGSERLERRRRRAAGMPPDPPAGAGHVRHHAMCACASTRITVTAASWTTRAACINDATLELLSREAVSHAQAGAQMVAPSDMMDGRVAAIRRALDDAGFSDVPILSLLHEVRQRLLRAVPRRGGFRPRIRRPPRLPDGFGKRAEEGVREAMYDIAEGADTWSWSSPRCRIWTCCAA
jgi:porphobilinogen synthase